MTAWVANAMTLRCEPWNKGRLIDQIIYLPIIEFVPPALMAALRHRNVPSDVWSGDRASLGHRDWPVHPLSANRMRFLNQQRKVAPVLLA
jgi:hypothetical protein